MDLCVNNVAYEHEIASAIKSLREHVRCVYSDNQRMCCVCGYGTLKSNTAGLQAVTDLGVVRVNILHSLPH